MKYYVNNALVYIRKPRIAANFAYVPNISWDSILSSDICEDISTFNFNLTANRRIRKEKFFARINVIKSQKFQHKGYITCSIELANGNLQQVIGLLDSGNSLASKCCLRTDIAEKLGLKIF